MLSTGCLGTRKCMLKVGTWHGGSGGVGCAVSCTGASLGVSSDLVRPHCSACVPQRHPGALPLIAALYHARRCTPRAS